QINDAQAVWALAHQLGHVLLHHSPGYPPRATTAGCTGLRKAEADSIAWITCTRHGITPASELPYPASWAGTDPRAQPAATILAAAQVFYASQLDGSWAPAYLHARGITPAAIRDWHIGYAPAGWTTLTGHLRRLGHHDNAIQAAGLATRCSRGTLIDRFRDRV